MFKDGYSVVSSNNAFVLIHVYTFRVICIYILDLFVIYQHVATNLFNIDLSIKIH